MFFIFFFWLLAYPTRQVVQPIGSTAYVTMMLLIEDMQHVAYVRESVTEVVATVLVDALFHHTLVLENSLIEYGCRVLETSTVSMIT